MPRRQELAPDAPERVRAAHAAISGTGRFNTLRFLSQSGPSTRQQIVVATGIPASSATNILDDLEDLGYLEADLPKGARQGRGRRPVYRLNAERLTADIAALAAYLSLDPS